jgi:polar amino acid transport system substrate-binding protein
MARISSLGTILRGAATAAILAGLHAHTATADEPVTLTSLSWPPYNGPELPNGGSNTEALRTLLGEAGYDLRVDFLPWKRAVAWGMSKQEYLGYFPEYYSDDLDCLWSKQFDKSVVGFVERIDNSLDWETVEDLKSYELGVVDGYVNDNGPFDAALKAGELDVQPVMDDATNVLKVMGGRIDAAVIDKRVLAHLLEKEVPSAQGKVRFDETPLVTNGLFVCFQPDRPKAKEVHRRLNEAIEGREQSAAR